MTSMASMTSSILDTQSLGNLTNNFSVSAWIKPDTQGGYRKVIASKSVRGLGFGDVERQVVVFDSGSPKNYVSAVSIPLNQWTHIAITMNSANTVEVFFKNPSHWPAPSPMPRQANRQRVVMRLVRGQVRMNGSMAKLTM